MAEIKPVFVSGSGKYKVWLWANVQDGDTCKALPVHEYDDITVYYDGDFENAGVTLVFQGAPVDSANYYRNLRDVDTNVISATADGHKTILDLAAFIKPSTSGGSSTQDIDIYLIGK